MSPDYRIPRVPQGAFARPRLAARLATGDIVIVHGPAGSGKTTLVAAWARDQPVATIWVAATDDLTAALEADARQHSEEAQRLLVIDHAERLTEDELRRLGAFVDREPAVRAVVITRSTRTILELGTTTDVDIELITPADLVMDLDELSAAMPGRPMDELRQLLEDSAGLVMAIRATEDPVPGRSHERYRSRLLQLLAGEPPELREALVRLAVVELVDPAIAAGLAIGSQWIEAAETMGLGVRQDDWFHISPFAKEVLRPLIDADVPESTQHDWLRTAIRLSLTEHRPISALRFAIGMRDLAVANEVAFGAWVPLLEQRDDVYRILSTLPVSSFSRFPGLVVLFTLVSNMDPSTRPRALQIMAATSVQVRTRPALSSARDRVVYRTFEASALRLTPLADRAMPMVRRVLSDLGELSAAEFESLGRVGPTLYTHLGISAMYCGEPEVATRSFETAETAHMAVGNLEACDPLSLRGGLQALLGDLPTARRLLDVADAAEWPPGWRESSPAEFFELGRAVLALEDGELDAAQAHLDAVGPFSDLIEHWPVFTVVQMWHDMLADDPIGGLARLQQVRDRRSSSPTTKVMRGLVDASEALLRLDAGDLPEAQRLASHAAKHSGFGAVVHARLQAREGRVSSAFTTLNRLFERGTLPPRLALHAGLLVASLCLRHDRQDDGDATVAYLCDLLETTGLRSPLVLLSAEDREVLVASASRIGRDGIAALIASHVREPRGTRIEAPILTARERVVLAELGESSSVAQIAERLYVSPNTVKSQLRSLYRKLGVTSREAALARAAAFGFLGSDASGDATAPR